MEKASIVRGFSAMAAAAAALAMVLACSFGARAAFALDAGTYSATLSPSYENPDTGQIEDAGGESSSALGTSMVQGIAVPGAVVSVDSSGAAKVTVTFKQAESLGDVKVASDESKSGSFGEDAVAERVSVDAGENTAEYSFDVPSVEATLRFKMYVEPMGRDVTFFATLDRFKETGSKAASSASSASSAASAASSSSAVSSAAAAPSAAPASRDAASSQASATSPSPEASEQPFPSGDAARSDAAADLNDEASAPSGVHEYSADGNEVAGEVSAQELANRLNYPLIIGGALALCLVVGLVAYLAYFRPRTKAYERAAEAAAPLVEGYFSRRNGGRGR